MPIVGQGAFDERLYEVLLKWNCEYNLKSDAKSSLISVLRKVCFERDLCRTCWSY